MIIEDLIINGEEWETKPLKFNIKQLNFGSNGDSQYYDTYVTGVNSILLDNAKEDSLNYVKIFGASQQSTTPTPLSPVDIVCNNGVIKVDSNKKIYVDGTPQTIIDSLSNTATASNLFAISGLRDEQELLSGSVVRNIGVKVLDGNENWVISNNWFSADILDKSLYNHLLCTHFKEGIPTENLTVSKTAGSSYLNIHYNDMQTVEELKTFLSEQYNNGTPVIVLYPLLVPITETIESQLLSTVEGNNTLTTSSAYINTLLIEAGYKRKRN